MKYIATLLGSAAVAAAHGVIQTADIGGKNYELYNPFQDPYMNPKPERISRPVPGNGPVEDVTSADIQCNGFNTGSSPAPLHAEVAAGSTVNLKWTLWPDSHVGPSITYLAKCPAAGCNDYMPGDDTVWFKVQEAGREGTSNNWGATPLMKEGNSGVDFTVPSCIEPGFYLVRHELIALHSAYSYPGAQFYPGCLQLKVTGGGSTKPTDLVGFPGAYSPTDPGITYDAYKAQEYIIPGPKLFTCSGSGANEVPAPATPTKPATTPSAAPSAPASTNTPPAATNTPAPATPSNPPADDEDEGADDECDVEPEVPEPEEDEGDDDECDVEQPEPEVPEPGEDEGDDDECDVEEPAEVQRRHWDRRY